MDSSICTKTFKTYQGETVYEGDQFTFYKSIQSFRPANSAQLITLTYLESDNRDERIELDDRELSEYFERVEEVHPR